VTARERREFEHARQAIERVYQRLGIPRQYRLRDWVQDQQLLRQSIRRKRALRRPEATRSGEISDEKSQATNF
jgi:hypothetical protein